MARSPRDLGQDVWQYQTSLWQTNCALTVAGGDVLLCDPSYMPREIEDLHGDATRRAQGAIYLLITHADFDHTCGIGYFPEAMVVAGQDTAELINSGKASASFVTAALEWGADWPANHRVDQIVATGEEVQCGAFRVATLDARGHQTNGLAFVLVVQGILLPGDYMSSMTYPFSTFSVAHTLGTCRRLVDALDRYSIRWVVPGHGPALAAGEARAVTLADIAYLERLTEAARTAVAAWLAPGQALVSVFGVEPPRPTTDDFEVYGLRTINAEQALAEAQGASS